MSNLTVPKITKNSLVGKILEADYNSFKALMKQEDNEADFFGKVDNTLAQQIEAGKDAKKLIDSVLRQLKNGEKKLRDFMTEYMLETGIKKIEGNLVKSITVYEPKVVKKTITKKQIKVGRSYKDLSEFSKEDLVKLLEEKGVKTRVVTEEVEEEKPAGIRVVR